MDMKVLVIDGPARGEVYDINGHRFEAINSVSSGQIGKILYYVHRFRIMNVELSLASTYIDPYDIPDFRTAQILDLILSDKAKEVIR